MDNPMLSFEETLNATVRVLRTTWKAKICLFLQLDDSGKLVLRAADGLPKGTKISIRPSEGSFAECITRNKVLPIEDAAALGSLVHFIKADFKKGDKYIMSPVSGETRILGILLLGPYSRKSKSFPGEVELRSAGALCAVLSAHWRMYEWMSSFVPQLNHELRTPLTAVQGSIGMLLGGVFGQVGSEVREMLEMAQKGCERTVRAIEEYVKQPKPTKESKSQ